MFHRFSNNIINNIDSYPQQYKNLMSALRVEVDVHKDEVFDHMFSVFLYTARKYDQLQIHPELAYFYARGLFFNRENVKTVLAELQSNPLYTDLHEHNLSSIIRHRSSDIAYEHYFHKSQLQKWELSAKQMSLFEWQELLERPGWLHNMDIFTYWKVEGEEKAYQIALEDNPNLDWNQFKTFYREELPELEEDYRKAEQSWTTQQEEPLEQKDEQTVTAIQREEDEPIVTAIHRETTLEKSIGTETEDEREYHMVESIAPSRPSFIGRLPWGHISVGALVVLGIAVGVRGIFWAQEHVPFLKKKEIEMPEKPPILQIFPQEEEA